MKTGLVSSCCCCCLSLISYSFRNQPITATTHLISKLTPRAPYRSCLAFSILRCAFCILQFFFGSDAAPPLNPSNTQLLKINTRCRNKSHPSFVCQPPHHPKRKRSSWGDIRQRMVISLYPGALGCTIHSGWFEVR